MATESDLRDLLRDPDPEGRPTIDLDAVLTRARRRRRPKVIAAQAIGSVAVVGAVFTGVVATLPTVQTATMTAEDAGGAEFASEPGAADADLRWAMDACGAPPVDAASPAWSLETAVTGTGDSLTVTLTLRNDGEEGVAGDLTPWAVTIVRDGVVVGTASFTEAVPGGFALGAGDAVEATLGAVVDPCDPGVPLAPGAYEVRGVAEVVADDAAGRTEVVYGELAAVELR